MLDKKEIIKMKLYASFLISKKKIAVSNIDENKQKIVVALAADYGNLGDVAITYAQTSFLKKHFPNVEVIDFPISKTFSHMKSLKSIVQPNDIITIVGGGNTGDLYDDIEFCRQFIISQFPSNRIICFPQTIDFSETATGNNALQKAVKVYGRHKNLSLSAREEKSFNEFKNKFINNRVVMAPDIVLSLDESDPTVSREGITFVLRSDSEKNMDEETQQKLINKISTNYDVRFQDTHIDKSKMSVNEREKELCNIWNQFKKSEVVITDRLHGMIFSAITNTPCIAIDNSNKKVSGVYNAWLKDFSTIEVVENIDIDIIIEKIKFFRRNSSIKTKEQISMDSFNPILNSLKE